MKKVLMDGKYIKKCVIAAVAAVAVIVIYLLVHGFFDLETLSDKYRTISNAFFVPGSLMICSGALIWISTMGFFDLFSFSFKKLYERATFKREHEFEKYYDYKEHKEEKGRATGYSFLFLVGGVLVFVSIIFDILFNFSQFFGTRSKERVLYVFIKAWKKDFSEKH